LANFEKINVSTAKKSLAAIVTVLMFIAMVVPLVGAATVETTVVTATPGNPITVTAGTTTIVNFQISLTAGGKLDSRITESTPATTKVQTQYYLTDGTASSNTWSNPIQFYDSANSVATKNNVVAASITVDATTPAGNYQVDVVVDTPTNPTLTPQANANQLLSLPNTPGKILIHVVEPSDPQVTTDTTPPTITAPASFTFEGNTLGGANIPATLSLGAATAVDIIDPSPVVTNDFTGGFVALGQSLTVTWTAADASGNKATATQTIIVIDTTAPFINAPATASVVVNAPKTALTATAYDIVWGTVEVTSNAPEAFQPGATTVTWTSTDSSGNTATANAQVQATYNFIGFYSPVGSGLTSKAGSTIPIKFALTDYYGNYVTTATATITFAKVTATGLGVAQGAAAQGATGFRYDTSSNQYIFNWATPKTAGTYQLQVALNDGTLHTVNVTLK